MFERRILVVDDDEIVRLYLEKWLTKMGYSPTVAESAAEALKILETEKIFLIITDLEMPGMKGDELCKRIRQKDSRVIVYALSGYLGEYGSDYLDIVGFDGYLPKPLEPDIMKSAIDGAFELIQRKPDINKS